MTTSNRIMLNDNNLSTLQNDDVFPTCEMVATESILVDYKGEPLKATKGKENTIISNGKVVNFVSDTYGHLPNEQFFLVVEEKLINADIQYVKRSINRNDSSFAVDYILNDDRYDIIVSNGKDTIKPMLHFHTSYDSSCVTFGSFGIFRRICSNGLHIAETKLSFSIKKRGKIAEFVIPHIETLINEFLNNEYFEIKKKADAMSGVIISDVAKFVKQVCDETKLLTFVKSEKNPEPSKRAMDIIDVVNNEAHTLGVEPNKWLIYNAFNGFIHSTLQKTFDKQSTLDAKLFEAIHEMQLN